MARGLRLHQSWLPMVNSSYSVAKLVESHSLPQQYPEWKPPRYVKVIPRIIIRVLASATAIPVKIPPAISIGNVIINFGIYIS